MEIEVVTDKRGRTMIYRRYTQPGTGPANGRKRVGDVVTQQEIMVDYIECKTPWGTHREHMPHGRQRICKPVKCKILAITQRRNGYVDKEGNFQVHYYDSWFKLRTPGGWTFWNTGAERKHYYTKVGFMNFTDEKEYSEWTKKTWKEKKKEAKR